MQRLCTYWAGNKEVLLGNTQALGIAANNGRDECLRLLIAGGVSILDPFDDPTTAHAAYVDYLTTALHLAVRAGHESTCRLLINEGASLTMCDSFEGARCTPEQRAGQSPLGFFLRMAIEQKKAMIAKRQRDDALAEGRSLVERYPTPKKDEKAPRSVASSLSTSITTIAQVRAHPIHSNLDKELQNVEQLCHEWAGNEVITQAVEGSCATYIGYDFSVVKNLIAAGVNISICGPAMTTAATRGDGKLVRMLIDEGCPLSGRPFDDSPYSYDLRFEQAYLMTFRSEECKAMIEAALLSRYR